MSKNTWKWQRRTSFWSISPITWQYEGGTFNTIPGRGPGTLKKRPISSIFKIKQYEEHLDNSAVAIVHHKQARLYTIYEQLGHLIFHRPKLLARSGTNPKELANVDAPICPGCAYGKAHRKPTQSKGARLYFRIFRYFPVVPNGNTFTYDTIKRKRNKEERQINVVSTRATADPHIYFLRRSALKVTFLLKKNNHASTRRSGCRK